MDDTDAYTSSRVGICNTILVGIFFTFTKIEKQRVRTSKNDSTLQNGACAYTCT